MLILFLVFALDNFDYKTYETNILLCFKAKTKTCTFSVMMILRLD